MFGYILPEKPELKIKEYEMFRAFYCGICKSIARRYGQIPRITLNYDTAFLAVLLSSISQTAVKVKRERCIVHPIHKRHIARDNAVIDYASDMNLLLAYYNLEDNIRDERSLLSAAGVLTLKSAFKKLRSKYYEKCGIIEAQLAMLSELEKEKCSSMDQAAEPFARLMEEVMAYAPVCADKRVEKVIKCIGYNMGKWIYILDAYDDLGKDIKRNSYNPLRYQYGYGREELEDFKARIKEKVEFNLTYSLAQISKAYELLEPTVNKGIVENIIYMGMLRKTEQILEVGSCNRVEKSV